MVVCGFGAIAPQTAFAEERKNTTKSNTKIVLEENEWYREPLLAGYLVPPVALGVTALVQENPPPIWFILVGGIGVFTPPVIHVVNDNSQGAWGSFLGMVGASGAGALLGATVAELAPECGENDTKSVCRDDIRGLLVGSLASVGYLSWVIIDVALFARVPVSKKTNIRAGLRPLVVGRKENPNGSGVMVSGAEIYLEGRI
jgi:hypothetical protein